ncbi:hypothetical protein BU24DRAFT_469682 [Aaosphaeria arxii CBS 175.79]|uniref:C3H1-type domain-containing protein n=1 Tax=Aaosphaeria arxii CBS 175.79 TaxID=1450172 RepID=A0A6A5Y6T3_9PLEO|nr:uncharacterized protein BU24DRAFT_469682 [Aaosphaeria arxii CBS 175.79]KAF2020933.1 hypothetical protein BU24DRAFT_469682 [Aaosphaeria arxii CBS 175.79]
MANPAATTASASQQDELADGVRYYIVRKGAVMVPLIPADRLPCELLGVPRQLSHQQISKQKLEFVAETSEPASLLHMHSVGSAQSSTPKCLAPDHLVRTEASERDPQKHVEVTPAHVSRSLSPIDSQGPIYPKDTHRSAPIPRSLPPSGVEPDPSKKEYCTYWIRTGECAYTAEGCKFKHDMPSMNKLRELGFTRLPLWWKEKTAVRLQQPWMQRRLHESKGERPGQAPAAPVRHPLFKHILDRQMKEINVTVTKKRENEKTDNGAGQNASKSQVPKHEHDRTEKVVNLIDLEPVAPPPSPSSTSPGNTPSPIDSDSEYPISSCSSSDTHGPLSHQGSRKDGMATKSSSKQLGSTVATDVSQRRMTVSRRDSTTSKYSTESTHVQPPPRSKSGPLRHTSEAKTKKAHKDSRPASNDLPRGKGGLADSKYAATAPASRKTKAKKKSTPTREPMPQSLAEEIDKVTREYLRKEWLRTQEIGRLGL